MIFLKVSLSSSGRAILDLCQYLGHKKLNFILPACLDARRIVIMLLEPHLQPLVAFYGQVHYDDAYGCKMTLYIQRALFLPLPMYGK
ncbi:hypothetical protein ASU35_08755 [Acetivibrio ethanolgignens]|uniref:Uncharacterized protein n=1 Tax=Acetivibrio ethanolgignens TaxID=290052 RepID=A0A0V8QG22_9FIRM|nr:hypothetical protein ASU35_08755 [Acetivibrio ethanolgignens]